MNKKYFLFNDMILPLDAGSDPRLDPSFPLSKEQYENLTIDDLMLLLREEYHSDPNFCDHKPRTMQVLCALLHAKAGVNCVKVHWDGYGVSSRHGSLPEESMATLSAMERAGKLTEQVVENTVWSQLDVA